MNNLKGIKPGDDVHVITEYGDCDTYMFLAKVKHAVLAAPFQCGKEEIKDALDAMIYDTMAGMGAEVNVFPAKMCFADVKDAAAAIEEMREC